MSEMSVADALVLADHNGTTVERVLAARVRKLEGAVPEGHMRDSKGVDRPIHGVAPITADGWIGGSMSPVWTLVDGKAYRCYLSMIGELGMQVFVAGTTTCYTTRAAAEAARGTEQPNPDSRQAGSS